MKTLINSVLLLLIFGSAGFSQRIQCDASMNCEASAPIYVEQTYQSVEYAPQVVERRSTVQYVPLETGINFNADCAIKAATEFRDCRAAGGGVFPCLLDGAITYFSCPGAITQRWRARRLARRARWFGRY